MASFCQIIAHYKKFYQFNLESIGLFRFISLLLSFFCLEFYDFIVQLFG